MNNIFKLCQVDRHKFCSHIINSSSPKPDFYFLIILSTLIVALGLLANNIILVIGGMLVTPLLSPLLAIALGLVIGDLKVTLRSVKIFLNSLVFVIFVAFVVGSLGSANIAEIDLIAMMTPSLLAFFIAVVAGLAASYAWAKPGLNETLPGVSIAVTLIPPLTAIGLAAAGQNWIILITLLKVLLLNIFGIILASFVVFTLMDFYKARKKVIKEVKAEEKELKKNNNYTFVN
ncbi:MAG: DUF389 domain-containing protein [bacterium]